VAIDKLFERNIIYWESGR